MVRTFIGRRGSTRTKRLPTGSRIQGIQAVQAISFRGSPFRWNFPLKTGFRDAVGGIDLDSFQRLEALVDSADFSDIKEANVLLRHFKGRSGTVTAAIDEFMLDFMTLVFVVETGHEGFQKSLRTVAVASLSKIERLVGVPA